MTYAAFTLALLIGAADAGTERTAEPTIVQTRPLEPTPAPTLCVCEELGYFLVGGVCSRGCDLDEDGEEFDSPTECCASIGFEGGSLPDCPLDDECGTPFPSLLPTFAPTVCVCEELGYVVIDGVCSRGCSLEEDGEFDSLEECCDSIGFEDETLPGCPVDDECGTPFPSPVPTLAPTLCDCEELNFVVIDGVCSRGCSLDEEGEFDDVFECCESLGFVDNEDLPDCPVNDECGTPFPTPAPCDCAELDFVVVNGVCSRGCSVDEDGEFDSVEECCASIGFEGAMMLPGCPVFDECPAPDSGSEDELGPCTSTSKSGKSGAGGYYYSGDMSMGFIDCFTSSSSKSGKSGSKGGKSGGSGRGHKGGKSRGKSGGGGHRGKGGKSGSKCGKSGGSCSSSGSSDGHSGDGYMDGYSGYGGGHDSSSSHSGKGGKSGHKGGKSGGGGHGHKGGKSGGGGHDHKGGKSGSKCGKSGGSCSSSSSSDSHYDSSSDSRSYAGGYGYGGGYHHDSHSSHSSSSSSSGKHGKSGKRRTQETRGLRRAHLR